MVGAATGRPYGFSRRQVEKRAPGLCAGCGLRERCPIQGWPPSGPQARVEAPAALRHDPDLARTAGPAAVERGAVPEVVWLTGESLGDADPALDAHPGLPAVWVWDEPLLARLRLSGKRLVFLAETLADLGARRPLEIHRGDSAEELRGRRLAVTHAPVPGFHSRARALAPVEVHLWPWLVAPHAGPAGSFTAWHKAAGPGASAPRGRPAGRG